MAQIRAQVVFQGGSNLPEDRFVNTFHFVTSGDFASTRASVSSALAAFYGNAAGSVSSYLSEYVARTYSIKLYDLADAEPRQPTVTGHTMATYPAGALWLPEEVAVTASFRGDQPYTARRRGRVFIGPVNSNALSSGSTSTPTRVATGFRSALNTAMTGLKAASVGWSVYSRASGLFVPVTNGWVDNAFDTQRRRGIAQNARSPWT